LFQRIEKYFGIDRVLQYEARPERQRGCTFQEEYRELLRKRGVPASLYFRDLRSGAAYDPSEA
jgi:hypothetical protein